jgi:hypothetical protein
MEVLKRAVYFAAVVVLREQHFALQDLQVKNTCKGSVQEHQQGQKKKI